MKKNMMTKDAMIMNNIADTSVLLLLLMMFAHVIDDFNLQGIMASMKQKSWWEKTNSADMYRYDYIAALIMHSLSWSFMIMLPLMLFGDISRYIWVFPINVAIHAIVDDAKANRHKINLIQDQSIHMVQIILTWIICIL